MLMSNTLPLPFITVKINPYSFFRFVKACFYRTIGAQVVGSAGNLPATTNLLDDDDVNISGAGSSHPEEFTQPKHHLCRAVRRDNMSRLNLQGAVHIRDADFIIEDFGTQGDLAHDKPLVLDSMRSQLYTLAWPPTLIQYLF